MGFVYSKKRIIIGLIFIIISLIILNIPLHIPQTPRATIKEIISQLLVVPPPLFNIIIPVFIFLYVLIAGGILLVASGITKTLKNIKILIWTIALICIVAIGIHWYLAINPLPESKKADMAAVARAREDIETYRKDDVILNIVDAQGQPCSGIAVDYVQTKSSFLFSFYNKEVEDADTLITPMKEAGFNSAIHMMNWKMQEPEPGVYDFDGWDNSLETQNFHQAELDNIGYSLYTTASVPEFVLVPPYAFSLSFEELKKAAYQYVYKTAEYYENKVKIWNIFNEPMMLETNALGLNEQQEIEIIEEGIRAIRDAGSEAKIMIVVWPPGGELSYMHPYDFLQDTIKAGVNFDIIGLEWYYNSYGAPYWGGGPFLRRSLVSIGEIIDKYSTLGKTIFVEEISMPSEAVGRGYWGEPWSEELQSEYLEAAYTIFFSKPQIIGIGYWDVLDRGAFIYHGGLLDEQNQPKKAYFTLKNLIKSWTTTGAGVTDENGQVIFRGFGGTYEVTVSDPETGLSMEKEIIIEEQENNIFTFKISLF